MARLVWSGAGSCANISGGEGNTKGLSENLVLCSAYDSSDAVVAEWGWGKQWDLVKFCEESTYCNMLCQRCVPMELGPCGDVCCKHCHTLYYYGNYCRHCPETRDLLM